MTNSSISRGGPVVPSHSTLRSLSAEEISVTGGFWGDKQQLNAEVIIDHCETWMERIGWIGNFDRAADGTIDSGAEGTAHVGIEFIDSEIYKLLEAMAWELGRSARSGPRGAIRAPRGSRRGRAGRRRLPAHELRSRRPACALLRSRVGPRALLLRPPHPGRGRATAIGAR